MRSVMNVTRQRDELHTRMPRCGSWQILPLGRTARPATEYENGATGDIFQPAPFRLLLLESRYNGLSTLEPRRFSDSGHSLRPACVKLQARNLVVRCPPFWPWQAIFTWPSMSRNRAGNAFAGKFCVCRMEESTWIALRRNGNGVVARHGCWTRYRSLSALLRLKNRAKVIQQRALKNGGALLLDEVTIFVQPSEVRRFQCIMPT